MLILAAQMRGAARSLRRTGHAFKKVTAVRISLPTHSTVWLPYQLRNDVIVLDRRKEFRNGSKPQVGVHLFNMSLTKPLGVGFVRFFRRSNDKLAVSPDGLLADDWLIPVVHRWTDTPLPPFP